MHLGSGNFASCGARFGGEFRGNDAEAGWETPIVVFEDTDLDAAANALAAGNFGASGQPCVAGCRRLVQRSVPEALIAYIAEKAKGLLVGDPHDPATHLGSPGTKAEV